jgi:hypothetical protein
VLWRSDRVPDSVLASGPASGLPWDAASGELSDWVWDSQSDLASGQVSGWALGLQSDWVLGQVSDWALDLVSGWAWG